MEFIMQNGKLFIKIRNSKMVILETPDKTGITLVKVHIDIYF